MHHLGICKSNQPSGLTRKPPRKSRFPTIHHLKKTNILTISSFLHVTWKLTSRYIKKKFPACVRPYPFLPPMAHPIIPTRPWHHHRCRCRGLQCSKARCRLWAPADAAAPSAPVAAELYRWPQHWSQRQLWGDRGKNIGFLFQACFKPPKKDRGWFQMGSKENMLVWCGHEPSILKLIQQKPGFNYQSGDYLGLMALITLIGAGIGDFREHCWKKNTECSLRFFDVYNYGKSPLFIGKSL